MTDPFVIPRGNSESNYDVATLVAVNGSALSTATSALKTQGTNVANGISAINTALNGLKLGWAGATQQEASDFINRWNAVATALFGTPAAATDNRVTAADGLLNVMAGGLEAVLDSFNEAETEVLKNFTTMFTSLTPSTADDTPSTGNTSTSQAGSDPVIVSD